MQCVSFELYFLDNKLSHLLPPCITAGELYTLGVYRHQKCDLPGLGNVSGQQSNTRATSSSRDHSSSLSMLETVPFIDGEQVVQIASGTEHSALVTGKSFFQRLEDAHNKRKKFTMKPTNPILLIFCYQIKEQSSPGAGESMDNLVWATLRIMWLLRE